MSRRSVRGGAALLVVVSMLAIGSGPAWAQSIRTLTADTRMDTVSGASVAFKGGTGVLVDDDGRVLGGVLAQDTRLDKQGGGEISLQAGSWVQLSGDGGVVQGTLAEDSAFDHGGGGRVPLKAGTMVHFDAVGKVVQGTLAQDAHYDKPGPAGGVVNLQAGTIATFDDQGRVTSGTLAASARYDDATGASVDCPAGSRVAFDSQGALTDLLPPLPPADTTAGQVNLALGMPASQSSTYTGTGIDQGAAAGVDGIMAPAADAYFMFHTDIEPDPWWQVDLGNVHTLTRIVLFNRTLPADPSGVAPKRANTIQVLISPNGTAWRMVHDQGGRDWVRLDIGVAGEQARFVKVQLAEENYLHLYEVQVFGMP
jgi:hypothetical protein